MQYQYANFVCVLLNKYTREVRLKAKKGILIANAENELGTWLLTLVYFYDTKNLLTTSS